MQRNYSYLKAHLLPGLAALLISSSVNYSCNSGKQETTGADSTKLDSTQRLPENALKGLEVAEGLEVRTFATEPMLKNPTNIDVDEKGRVWVTEAYNYRPEINGNPTNPKGDRIIILEDANGDGKAETSKVFYQGPEINAPLGVAVLGKRVLISQSPYVWAFYDDNGDDKADRKEIIFQGIKGEQHDHGMHTFTFGPDGKLYFNFGNAGETLRDKNNKVVLDQDGDPIDQKKYRQGMVFRCDPDGTNVECLGQNFRNNYEVAVDSYGTMWQSDNDDDGNRGVRINYVMEYGNYGYTDEMTGAGWQANRTNMEDSIPLQHWHLNDPGVIPNLLQTGAGSPTGMVIYEGNLLPKEFQGQMIHTDAGPNVVRSYPVEKNGAGYSAKIVNILKGEKDQWFRPADVCVAPDGSLIVADWYDPGVGGHQAGDQQRGRIYRVAPADAAYKMPQYDYSKPAEAVKALQNPNLAVRHHAWNVLQQMNKQAIPELEKLWQSSSNPRMRARAFWALVKIPGNNAAAYIQQAVKDANPDLRITGLRAARELKSNVIGIVQQLINDKDPQVRRECAIALRHNNSPEAAELWATLANKHDGKDRWYLEALGIGADKQWDKFFAAYAKKNNNDFQSSAQKDIVWRARTELAVPYLAQLAGNQTADLKSRLRYFRAFDFNTGPAKSKYLLAMLENNASNNVEFNKLVLRHLDPKTVASSPAAQKAMKATLKSIQGSPEYIELVSKYEIKTEKPALLELAISKHDDNVGRDAAGLLLKLGGENLAQSIIKGKDLERSTNLLKAMAGVGSEESINLLQNVALSNSYPVSLRNLSAEMIGKSWAGEERVLTLLKNKKVPASLIPPVVAGVSGAWRKSVRDEAASYLPNSKQASANRKAPTMKELAALKANAANGQAVFKKACSVCHQVAGQGNDFGPKLTEIGSKLPKEGLLEAIVHPSSGISFGYEGWQINMKDGSAQTGIIASKTETDIDLKFPGGAKQHLKTADVKSMKELKESMMPDGLDQTMSKQELADLLAYLSSLKKK
ncbi:PVC-type heme-binding CxxCH protein [Rubrolithibacter danxiaensis]|uniref:PVC-type heme-binding CxxCH protein n=1 Tax=Rubrolithibacter danxiaensis TaxID=3390805 RepID=UPI003BF8C4B4